MTYKKTLDWLFDHLPMYQQKGKVAYNAKLGGIERLAAHLDHPEHKFKSIHVAGTNGKGSSCHMLASIFQEAGYRVGLYTSPHLKDYRERIKINGKPISKTVVVEFISRNRSFLEKHELSFFEMSVGLAFEYFAVQKVDIAIVEVGLGGRLDSTNIIVPEVSLITNIGLDHVDILGNTLEKIAIEKAGIIKEGVPVVLSETQEDLVELFKEVARKKKTQIFFAQNSVKKNYKTSLLGHYQKKNSKGVVAVLKLLEGFEISEEAICDGFMNVSENTGLLGRWQILQKAPMVVCDTAHNTEGLRLVLAQLEVQPYEGLHVVLGFVKGKNLDRILALFPKKARYYFASPTIFRAMDARDLAKKAKAFGLKGKAYPTVPDALEDALKMANRNDFIFVGGSTFTVAEVV